MRLVPFLSVVLIQMCLAGCDQNSAEQVNSFSSSNPPNIIYILADDMGYGDLGCYGQQIIATPNIDRLAVEGMRFTQHYAGATVCAPSRASLLTGKHPGHSSVRGNQPPGQLLLDGEQTIPEVLKSQGYTTAIMGKWGIGHPPPPDDPLRNGFDQAYGYINMWHAHNFYPEFLYKNGQRSPLEGNITDWNHKYPEDMPEGTGVAKEKETYAPFSIEEEALRFIDAQQDNPFFLYLALNMPHANNEAGTFLQDGMEVPDYGQYLDKEWPGPEKGFARMMELIDQTVGKIVQQLQDLGLEDRTLIIFTSDNGPHQEGNHQVDFFDSNGQLRGQKRDLYEGGIRVPMIASWPGTIPAGASTDHVSAFWDVLPTFCELTGTAIPDESDGISFLPTLLGQADKQAQHNWLYWEFYEQGGRQAIRAGKWKYIKLNVRDPEQAIINELYDLEADLSESRNLIDQHPDIVIQMEEFLESAYTPHPMIELFPR